MKKDNKDSFVKALDKSTILIYFLTTAFLLALYVGLASNKERLSGESYTFLTGICLNIVAVLIGIVISYFAFSYSREITDQHKREELVKEISKRISESTKSNKPEEQVLSTKMATHSIFKDERYSR